MPIFFMVAAYLFGGIPFGLLIAKSRGIDITQSGSKNIGSTNVYRVLGKGPGLLVFALDVLKGALPAAIGGVVMQSHLWGLYIGIVAMLGHVFSVFLKFKGGKGVATTLGALLGAMPLVGLSAFAVFLLVLAVSRIVSVSSCLAASTLVLWGWTYHESDGALYTLVAVTALILIKHRANFGRLMRGEEPKLGRGRKISETTSDQ